MGYPQPLPASPALELESKATPKLMRAVEIKGQPSQTIYRLPEGYQNEDLKSPNDPPASLGQFFPKAAPR